MRSRALLRGFATLVILAGTLMPTGFTALATPPATHNVSTCADLATLGADPSVLADTINLTADLDCFGVTFNPMFAGGFTGTLDGQGHRISHLTINDPGSYDVGLISNTNGATIQNLDLISGSVTGSNATGALIGAAKDTTIKNVGSVIAVESAGDQVGGLVGFVENPGTTLLEDVNVIGNVTNTAGTYIGGIIGLVLADSGDAVTLRRVAYGGSLTVGSGWRAGGLIAAAFVTGNSAAAALTIEDSFNIGTVDTGSNEVGGILGSAIATGNGVTSTISLNRVYNSGSVTGTDGVGGLFGITNSTNTGDAISITDSFSVGSVTASVAHGGALVGSNDADPPTVLTVTNSFYDGPGTGQSVCATSQAVSGTCTNIDTAVQPNYFKSNHANAPLDGWDFTGTWTAVPGQDYPLLIPADDGDGISKADETAGPNNGDANGDGTTDAAQKDVASFPDPVSGHYAVLQSSCGELFNTEVGAENTTPGQTDAAYSYPGGLVRFVATGCTTGETATITQYFFGLSATAQYSLRKHTATGYTTVPGATFSGVTLGGQSALKAVYQVTDGSSLDDDATADGNIVDPAGPAVFVVGVPNTGLGGQMVGGR